jgi:hypothetical protein
MGLFQTDDIRAAQTYDPVRVASQQLHWSGGSSLLVQHTRAANPVTERAAAGAAVAAAVAA